MDRKISFSGICRSEHGRTMLETLGVLALMGIISLLGVLSYGYAMRQYRENETVDQFSKTIASARTGFLKEQYMDKLQESVDSSGNLVYRLVNSSGGIETAPIIIPIRDIISGVDFNDENGPCPYASDDYCRTHWPDSFHTLIGADISVQIDNPEEFSVMIRGKSTKAGDYVEGHSVCRKLLGANFGQNSVYLKSMEGGMDSPRYTPSSLMGDEDKIDELCDQAVALATEETAGHFKMSLVFVFGNRVVTRCESDSDCVPANDYETCQCLSGMCICNEAEDLCYEHHGGLLTQEIYGGNLSGAWPSLEGSGLPTLTGSGKIGADCCEGAMIDMNQDVGYHASSPGFVYVDYKTGLIDCCPAGKSYELIGGSDVRHPMYYYTDDHNDKIYLRYALCDADRTCSGEAPYYCLDGCCSEECKYDGYCTKIDNGCDCKAGEVCMSAIMDSRTHGYFTQEDSFAGGALCCAKDRVYYDLMTGSLSCCDGTVDVQGGSSYLLNGHQEVASGCCGDCGTFTFVQETTVVPIECKDPAYPYACLDNADDSYGMCCSDSGCGGSCIDPEITTNVHCPDESKPYWCSGSESCCSKPCVGDQCITDCGSQSWCAKGGVKQTGACCDECCEDGTCASDYEGGECPSVTLCDESQVACYNDNNILTECCDIGEVCLNGTCEKSACPDKHSACQVNCEGVAKCDIVNLADNSYFGPTAEYASIENLCCPSSATVYYRTDLETIDCCPADEEFTQNGVSNYADNSDGSCTPRIPIGICGEKSDPCKDTGGTACYANDESGSVECCLDGYECVDGKCILECSSGQTECRNTSGVLTDCCEMNEICGENGLCQETTCAEGEIPCGESCCDSEIAECVNNECLIKPSGTCPLFWKCPAAVGYRWNSEACTCEYDPCYPDDECPISCGECYYPDTNGECIADDECLVNNGGGSCSVSCAPEECYPYKDEANCTCGENVCEGGEFNPYCAVQSEEKVKGLLVYQKDPVRATCVSSACCEGTFGGTTQCNESTPRVVSWTSNWNTGDGICCKTNDTPYQAGRDSGGNPTAPWACCSAQTQQMCGDGKTCCDRVDGYPNIDVCYKKDATKNDYSCCSTGDLAHPSANTYECCGGAKIYTPNSCDKPSGGSPYTQCCDGETYKKAISGLLECNYWGCCETLEGKNFIYGTGEDKTCCATGTYGYMDGSTPKCCAGQVGHYNGVDICCPIVGTRPINATTCCATNRVYMDSNGIEQCCPRDLNNGTCTSKVKKCGSNEEVDCFDCDISDDNCCCA